ncbi:MAG: Alcohol dehydrogenase [Candidatus Heimdallarchaeota archaeon LC_2]|nr:MAG: Alcohol dehydrogenase [Candidatus Heimdallarchaeota archaeon LC_2]
MRAAVFFEHGSSDKLQISEIELPPLKANEVKIGVKAFALNRLDIFTRNGHPSLKLPLPHVGASDYSGIIIEVGENVENFKIGDRVLVNAGLSCKVCTSCLSGENSECDKFSMIGEHHWGGAAEYAQVPITNVLKIPDFIEFVDAAASSLTTLTAYRMLHTRAKIKNDELILIIGASGGVGTMGIQIAKLSNATIIAITSTDEKLEKLQKLGVDHVINYREFPNWSKEVYNLSKSMGRKGVDIVLDSVGEAVFEQAIRSLRKGGRYVTCGATSGTSGRINLALLFWKQLTIMGSTMASDSEFKDALQLLFDNKIKPVIDKVYNFEEIKDAHDRLESGNHFGKIVLTI